MEERTPVDVVRDYLRAQNLEQVERIEEAVVLYERAVTASFDAAGPYDRLIAIYSARARHADVIRVAEAALQNVHTYEDKRAWYERMKVEARKALAKVPPAAPKR